MYWNSTRAFTISLLASGIVLLGLLLFNNASVTQQASAADLTPNLTVEATPNDRLTIGEQLVLTLTITNPLTQTLSGITLTQQLSPTLPLLSVSFNPAIAGCENLNGQLCANASVLSQTTALITVTYGVEGEKLVDKPITHTTTLSAPALLVPLVATGQTPSISRQNLALPLLKRVARNMYTTWVKLPPPAGGLAVNFLYISQESTCTGPDPAQSLPTNIFAATNGGIYQLKAASEWDKLPTWELRVSNTISVSHIISTSLGYFAGSFSQGGVLKSVDGGRRWDTEPLPGNNQRVYWLASSGERVLAAGNRGLFVRDGGVWAADPDVTGAVFSVAAAGQIAYAVQIGATKDTLWRSTQGGAAGSWTIVGQLPNAANFMQTLDLRTNGSPELLIGVVGKGIYKLGPAGIEPFSSGIDLTAYGIWRDSQGLIYAAFREQGGLRRFEAAGGTGILLNELPGEAPPISARLYTVNGNTDSICNIIATGSREGDVWLRRIPLQ